MFGKSRQLQIVFASGLIATFLLSPLIAGAQDLIAVNSIAGSSSIFVFRSAPKVKRFVAAAKPVRSKTQRMESVTRIKKQYETLAKVTPRSQRATVVDPSRAFKALSPAEGSKRLAGVGEYYLQQGDLDQSIDRFREAINLDEKNVAAKNGLSEVLAAKGNDLLLKDLPNPAKGFFLESLKYDAKNAAAYSGLGEVYSELDQFTEAIASYERSLENDKNLTEIYVPLGILYYHAGEIAKADDYLTKALKTSAGSSETQFFVGLVRSSQGRLEEALAAFQKAKSIDPEYAETYYNEGEVLVKLKKAGEAIPDYQKAVAIKPTYFDAWLGLAQAQFEAGNYTDAIPSFQTASRLRNDNWEANAGWGETYLKLAKYNDAAAKLNLGVTLLMRNKDFDKNAAADLYSKIGFAYGQQCEQDTANFKPCQWPAAVKALEKAVNLTSDPLDYANLGWALFNASRVDMIENRKPDQQAKLALAKDALQKAMAGNLKVQEGATQNLANVLIDSGDYAGAIDILKKLIEKNPDATFSKYALGTAYALANDNENAAKMYREVLEKEPQFISALKNLGMVEIKRKNGKEARKILDRLKPLSAVEAIFLENELRKARL